MGKLCVRGERGSVCVCERRVFGKCMREFGVIERVGDCERECV